MTDMTPEQLAETEPTRTRLLRVATEALIRARIFSFHEQKVEAVLDAILDELMEPGEVIELMGVEAALDAGLEDVEFLQVSKIWQAMHSAIGEGK